MSVYLFMVTSWDSFPAPIWLEFILVCTHFGLVAKSFMAITVGQYPAAKKYLARLYTYISVRGSCEDFIKMGEGGCGDFCWMSRGRMSTGHGVPYHP